MQKNTPTVRDVHIPGSASEMVSKPWTIENPPPPARNWTTAEKRKCIAAANGVLEDSGNERQAIFACIRAAGKTNKLLKCSDGVNRPLSILEKAHEGAMVALFLPGAVAQKLVIPGGLPPEELHITLAYLGPAKDLPDLGIIEAIVKEVAQNTPLLTGRIGGKLRFENPGQPEAAFCAIPNIPGLDQLRTRLVDLLEDHNIKLDTKHGFNPHVTLKYVGVNGRDPVKRIPPIDIIFRNITLSIGNVQREYPLRGVYKAKTFQPPESAQNNAKKVLRWRKEHPNEIKGMTSVGWRRASQLASGKPVSLDIVRRMAQFNRHRQNAKVDPKYKSEPWRDAGYVAWLGWGGSSGVDWARRISEANKMDNSTILKINDELVTLHELATTWLKHRPLPPPEPTEKSGFRVDFDIIKADELQRIVYGVPLRPDAVDSQGDVVSKDEIEQAAWNFMIKSQRYDHQHERLVPEGDAVVVESFLAPVDFELGGTPVKAGSWVLATKIFSDELWEEVQKGEINAYSIKGTGNRKLVE